MKPVLGGHYSILRGCPLNTGFTVFPFGFGAKKDRGRGLSVLTAREIKREPKIKKKEKPYPNPNPPYNPRPSPLFYIKPFFAWSLTVVPRSLVLNGTETLATQVTSLQKTNKQTKTNAFKLIFIDLFYLRFHVHE